MLDVSIVIVNYNGGLLLKECLTSLFTYTDGIRFGVTVFDNASTDGSLGEIEAEKRDAKIIRSSKNLGFAPANNVVIVDSSPARYFLLLNPDTKLTSNAVLSVMRFMDENPEIGICGPKVILADGKLDAPCRRSFKTPAIYFYHTLGLSRLFPSSPRFGKYYLSYLDEDQGCEVDSIIGAFMMIRCEVLEQIGLLDERFYVYGEDEDWCFRAQRAGWKVYYNPATTIIHQKGASTGKRRLPMIYQWHKAAYLFHKKNLAVSYSGITNGLVYLGIALHFSITSFFNVFKLGRKTS